MFYTRKFFDNNASLDVARINKNIQQSDLIAGLIAVTVPPHPCAHGISASLHVIAGLLLKTLKLKSFGLGECSFVGCFLSRYRIYGKLFSRIWTIRDKVFRMLASGGIALAATR